MRGTHFLVSRPVSGLNMSFICDRDIPFNILNIIMALNSCHLSLSVCHFTVAPLKPFWILWYVGDDLDALLITLVRWESQMRNLSVVTLRHFGS